jgi:hypothetical protein
MSSESSKVSFAAVRHLLYNHNPFYVISALLVLCGVWRSLAGQEAAGAGWPMLGILCGYIALLALAAWAIVRLGGVWQDARTLLVVIVVMLVALSMSFDAIAVLDLQLGKQLLVPGLAFAVAVSEATLRGLGIRLAWFFRGPYYAALGLLFVYPLWLADLVQREAETLRAWGLMLFPVFGAAILLTLWPAARWGRSRKWAAGAPWPWPLFPWTLFFFLALGFAARSYSLAFAFESNLEGESGFRAFWISPLILACAVLTLEMGLVAGSRAAQTVAVLAPLALIPLALLGPGTNATQEQFLSLLQAEATSPVVLTVVACIIFYAWAWLRSVQLAELGFLTAVALAAMVDATTVDWRMLAVKNLAPLGLIAVLQVVLSVRRNASWRMMLVVLLATAAACWPLRGLTIVHSGYAPLHIVVLSILVIGLVFDDRLARKLRRTAGGLIPGLAGFLLAASPILFPRLPAAASLAVAAAFSFLAVFYWRRERSDAHLCGALTTLGLLAAISLHSGYGSLDRTPLASGRDWLAAGLACLAIGLLISLAKAGVLRAAWRALIDWNRRFQESA